VYVTTAAPEGTEDSWIAGIKTWTVAVLPPAAGRMVRVDSTVPAYSVVWVTVVRNCGTCTTTVPVCPSKLGVATVVVDTFNPRYVDVNVVYWSGTWTTMVPVCPGTVGTAAVEVTVTEPGYTEVTVVNWSGNWTSTVPVSPGTLGTTSVEVVATEPEYADVIVVYGIDIFVSDIGTCTTTVPVCPGRIGTATVVVAINDPPYVDITVVNWSGSASVSGTWTITVPIWPGRLGVAAVDVAITDPEYPDVTVVNWSIGPPETLEDNAVPLPLWIGISTRNVVVASRFEGSVMVWVMMPWPVYNDVNVTYLRTSVYVVVEYAVTTVLRFIGALLTVICRL
jgi:hypothetical protein